MDQGTQVHVYVDETGDRGASPKSSPIFGMAAIVLDEAGVQGIRNAVGQLRLDFKVPPGSVLSWKEYVKTHDRRRRAADVLAAVTGIKVCYVYTVKSHLRPGS